MIASSVYNLRTRAVQSGVSKQYNVHEKVPQQIFMLVIMVYFKLYATVSRSAALIGDVSVALVQLQPSTGSRWQQRQMISPTEYIHN